MPAVRHTRPSAGEVALPESECDAVVATARITRRVAPTNRAPTIRYVCRERRLLRILSPVTRMLRNLHDMRQMTIREKQRNVRGIQGGRERPMSAGG